MLSYRRRVRQESDECHCAACMPAEAAESDAAARGEGERTMRFLAAVMAGAEARAWLLDDLEEMRA